MKLLIFLFIISSFNVLAQNGLIKAYYNNGKLESEVNYVNNVRDGEAKFYWETGKIKTELTYNNGKVEGLVKEYYPTGILKETYTLQDGKKEGAYSLYDESGAFISEVYYENGKRILEPESEEETETIAVNNVTDQGENTTGVKDKNEDITQVMGKVKESPQITADTMIGFVTTADVMPEPHGGWIWLYKKLSYPREARENKIEGTAKILAYIDEKGKVVEARIVEGFNQLCDDAARNAVMYTRFKPALVNGQEVKIKMLIPVEFKLP